MDGSFVEHIPVLSITLAEQIHLPRDGVMVDATIGQGGHSYLFGTELGPEGMILGLDVDDKSIQRAQLILKDLTCRVILAHANFADVDRLVHKYGIDKVDFLLADLGVCSAQLADEERGLSFRHDMPIEILNIDEVFLSNHPEIWERINNNDLSIIKKLVVK